MSSLNFFFLTKNRYLLSYDLALQIRAINVFISASSGSRFLAEFLEVGGVLTVLEIIVLHQATENDKAEALRLLQSVANNGRKYKEFVCESFGVRQVIECLSKSRSEITQDYARNLLVELGTGNPKFQVQVFKGLQSLLTSQAVSPTAQQMCGQALRILLVSPHLTATSGFDLFKTFLLIIFNISIPTIHPSSQIFRMFPPTLLSLRLEF